MEINVSHKLLQKLDQEYKAKRAQLIARNYKMIVAEIHNYFQINIINLLTDIDVQEIIGFDYMTNVDSDGDRHIWVDFRDTKSELNHFKITLETDIDSSCVLNTKVFLLKDINLSVESVEIFSKLCLSEFRRGYDKPDDLELLKQSVEFIRTKHKEKEALSFFEIGEAIDILHRADKTSLDPFIQTVAQKNIPYLQKRLEDAMHIEYVKCLGKIVDISTKATELKYPSYSGITDFKVSMLDGKIVILLNSDKDIFHTVIVLVKNNQLDIETLCTPDQIYVSDLIDMSAMIEVLEQNKIEYLHIVETGIYKMIDAWDNTRE